MLDNDRDWEGVVTLQVFGYFIEYGDPKQFSTIEPRNNALTGVWGSLTIATDGVVTWGRGNTVNAAAVDAISDGASEEYTVTYTVYEGFFLSSRGTLTLTINGVNDAPVLGEATTPTPDKVVTRGSDTAASSSFSYADPDDADTGFGSGGTIEGSVMETGSYTVGTMGGAVIEGTYGDLTLYANGTWSYELDETDTDTIALTASSIDSFYFRIDDGASVADNRYSNIFIVDVAVTIPGSTPATFEITSIMENDSGNIEVVVSRSTGSSMAAAVLTLSVSSSNSSNSYVDTSSLRAVFEGGSPGQEKELTINRVATAATMTGAGDTVTVRIVENDDAYLIGTDALGGSTNIFLADLRPAFSIAATGSNEADPLIFTVSRLGSNMEEAAITVDVSSRNADDDNNDTASYVTTGMLAKTITQGVSSVVFSLDLASDRNIYTGDTVTVTIRDGSYNIGQRDALHRIPPSSGLFR